MTSKQEKTWLEHTQGKLRLCRWHPDGDPSTVLQLVHGLAEHGGRYDYFAQKLTAQGIAVLAHDLPGHGESKGKRGHIDRFTQYTESVTAVREVIGETFPDTPVVLLGHSMGGLIAAYHLIQHQADYVAAVLSGPAIRSPEVPPEVAIKILNILTRVVPRLGIQQLDASFVSRDPAVVEAYREDPLVHNGKVTMRLMTELVAAMRYVEAQARQIDCPILALHGSDDKLTDPAGSEWLIETVASKTKAVKIYPGLYHEIFNEPERDQVIQDVVDWIRATNTSG